MNSFERQIIPANTRIHLIKSSRGTYIRTPDGKFFAIRKLPASFISQPKPMPVVPPPPPPPPLPQLPSLDLLDNLFSSSRMSSEVHRSLWNVLDFLPIFPDSSSLMNENEFNDEIDMLLFDDPPTSAVPPSSTANNLHAWQNDYLQSNSFYPNMFVNASNSNQYVSNPLTFT